MTFVCTTYVPTCIVVSGDSRTTLDLPATSNSQIQTRVACSDATEKVFIIYQRFVAATWGTALINGQPIAHFVAEYERSNPVAPPTILELATGLKNYLRAKTPIPDCCLTVSGFEGGTPFVYALSPQNDTVTRVNITQTNELQYGVYYAGDIAVVDRLLGGNQTNYHAMNIQDAVDFSRHLIRTTVNQLRFEPRFPTVGGPIDTAVITAAGGAQWVCKKKLFAD